MNKLEKEIVEKIINGEIEGSLRHPLDYPTVAYAVWKNANDEIEFGRVRWGHRNNYHTNEGVFDSLSCTPFPGAWSDVPVNRIIRISHHKAF